jgi:nucleotide-binding universal stress UspA family protein
MCERCGPPGTLDVARQLRIEEEEVPVFRTIVWATDGSDAADRAVPYVRMLAEQHRATVIVLHSVDRVPGPQAGPVHADEPEVDSKVEGQARELRDAGFDARAEIVGGSTVVGAAHVIADYARDNGADLIVVGTRGHTAIGGLLLGSVTNRLLHIAPCPVLSVPDRPSTTAATAGPSQPAT